MADIIFPVETGNVTFTSTTANASTVPVRWLSLSGNVTFTTTTANASTDPVHWISESGSVSITSTTASASTDPAFHIAETGTVTITGEAAGEAPQAIYIGGSGTVTITGEAAADWQRWLYCTGNALVTSGVVYANRFIRAAELSLELLPGESVIIDSETYNVWKDGISIIGSHSGAWFDDLTAETPNIDVNVNTSTIQCEIEFTPRYL